MAKRARKPTRKQVLKKWEDGKLDDLFPPDASTANQWRAYQETGGDPPPPCTCLIDGVEFILIQPGKWVPV